MKKLKRIIASASAAAMAASALLAAVPASAASVEKEIEMCIRDRYYTIYTKKIPYIFEKNLNTYFVAIFTNFLYLSTFLKNPLKNFHFIVIIY